jgi:urea transport system permease protein
MSPANSIEIAIWVAVGGRGTLLGPLLGAVAVNGAKSWLTAAFPDAWLYALGLLFILVTRYLPGGIASAVSSPLFRARRAPPVASGAQASPLLRSSETTR